MAALGGDQMLEVKPLVVERSTEVVEVIADVAVATLGITYTKFVTILLPKRCSVLSVAVRICSHSSCLPSFIDIFA